MFEVCSIELKNFHELLLVAILIKDSPMVPHKLSQGLLELRINHDFLEGRDDLVELEVFRGSRHIYLALELTVHLNKL